jgi:hypothetical protein
MTMPLGAAPQVDAGLPLVRVDAAGRPAVMLELLMNPSLALPTPRNNRPAVPQWEAIKLTELSGQIEEKKLTRELRSVILHPEPRYNRWRP